MSFVIIYYTFFEIYFNINVKCPKNYAIIFKNRKGIFMSKRIIEITVDSVLSAKNAELGGASRIELCQDLALGGTSPSYGLIKAVMKDCSLPMVVLVRPRSGDFFYDDYEFDSMLYDIEMLKDVGVKEVITGALDADGNIDVKKMEAVKKVFGEEGVCIHRAFDMCRDLDKAYETATKLGIKRILTSGGKDSAIAGIDCLARLNALEGPDILAGAGVNAANALSFKERGIRQLHLSAKTSVPSAMRYKKDDVSMGTKSKGNEFDKLIADVEKIKEIVAVFS